MHKVNITKITYPEDSAHIRDRMKMLQKIRLWAKEHSAILEVDTTKALLPVSIKFQTEEDAMAFKLRFPV